jgi:LuxR family maltose regulon positive regulatory protein
MRKSTRRTPEAGDGLLHTKLAPPRPQPSLVPRPALLARLDAGLGRKVTLVAAPAGFGKSTLVAEWTARLGREGATPVAWLALDAGDNDPNRFWRYAITACRAFDDRLGREALAALRMSLLPFSVDALTSFINELAALPAPCVLVLENYHLITAQAVHDALAYLIDHLPATLHLVLIARQEPPLPLARLRARNELSELGAADLRFTPDEVRAFLEGALGTDPAPELVARVAERTEGWVAGLRLMTLARAALGAPGAREQEIGPYLAGFGGGHRYVLEYLAGEVIATQPEALQEFLAQTSLLGRLTGGLCEAVTGRADSGRLLAELERANLFLVSLGDDGGRTWYRYHALFAEAMQQLARARLGQAGVRAVFERAGRWYEAQGLLDEAIEAALAAREHDRAATLIEILIDQRGLRELLTLRRWVGQIPEAVLYAHPVLCLDYAETLLFSLDRYAPSTVAAVELPLRAAEEAWSRAGDSGRLGQALSLRSIMALWQGDFAGAFHQAWASLELLPEHDTFWRGATLLITSYDLLLAGDMNAAQQQLIEAGALSGAAGNPHSRLAALSALGDIAAIQGEFDQASQFYQEVLAGAVGGEEMLDDQGAAHAGLAAVAYELDDLDTAEEEAGQAYALAERRLDPLLQLRAMRLLAQVQQARGHPAQAQEMLHGLAARIARPALLRDIQAAQAALALAAGNPAVARQWRDTQGGSRPDIYPAANRAEGYTTSRAGAPAVEREVAALLLARLQIAEGQPQAAVEALEPWRVDAHRRGRLRSELEILCVQALAQAAPAARATAGDQAVIAGDQTTNGDRAVAGDRTTTGDRTAAGQTLARALALAQPGGWQRLFLDEGEPLGRLLGEVIPGLGKRPLAAYATRLARAFAAGRAAVPAQPAGHAGGPLLEPLSPQELRVLRLLSAGLTNPEIAHELVVSTNTVKTQVQSIYRKLNANSRDEAAALARELGLV